MVKLSDLWFPEDVIVSIHWDQPIFVRLADGRMFRFRNITESELAKRQGYRPLAIAPRYTTMRGKHRNPQTHKPGLYYPTATFNFDLNKQ